MSRKLAPTTDNTPPSDRRPDAGGRGADQLASAELAQEEDQERGPAGAPVVDFIAAVRRIAGRR